MKLSARFSLFLGMTCLCPTMWAAQTKDKIACPTLSSEDFCVLSSGRTHKNLFATASGKKMLRKFCSPHTKGDTKGFHVGFVYTCAYKVPAEWVQQTKQGKNQTTILVARHKKKRSFACPVLNKKVIQKLLQGHSLMEESFLAWHLKTLSIAKKIKKTSIANTATEYQKEVQGLCAYHLNGLPINLYKNIADLT